MKRIILIIFGIVFTIITGFGLLICMISGIPTLEQPAATFYLVKAIILSFGFPLLAFGFFSHSLWLRHQIEKRDQLLQHILEELRESHQSSYSDFHDEASRKSRKLKDSITCLLCAFAQDSTLSKKDQKDLLDFIDKFK